MTISAFPSFYCAPLRLPKSNCLFKGSLYSQSDSSLINAANNKASGTATLNLKLKYYWDGFLNGLQKMFHNLFGYLTAPVRPFSEKAKSATTLTVSPFLQAAIGRVSHQKEQKVWEPVSKILKSNPHSVVYIDRDGHIEVDTSPSVVNLNIRNQTSTDNPLIHLARDSQKHIRENKHFVLIESRTSSPEQPRYLILPRPPQSKSTEPYSDLRDFLGRASEEEKNSLSEFLKALRPYNLTKKQCYWANTGKRREVPYLHIHFTPSQKIEHQDRK